MSIADHDLNITTETKSFLRHVTQVITFPSWHNTASVKGDFVILRLDQPVEFSRTASPICLPPDPTKTFSGEIATSIGWGVTEDGKPSKYLRQVWPQDVAHTRVAHASAALIKYVL